MTGDDSDLSETGKEKENPNKKDRIDKDITNGKSNSFFHSNIYDTRMKSNPRNSDNGGGRIKIF